MASKTLAEKAAWDFVSTHKNELKFDLVVLNPAIVLGPILHEVTDPMKLNMSMLEYFISVVAGARSNEELFAIKYAIPFHVCLIIIIIIIDTHV